MGTLVHLEDYRPCWRLCMMVCRACAYVWEGWLRHDVATWDVRCTECDKRGARMLKRSELTHLPKELRGSVSA